MEQREKLIELILKCNKDNDLFDCFPDRPRYRQAAEILADHLISNGIVMLPCKVGDTVYEPITYCDKGGAPFSKCYVGNSCKSCNYYISKIIAYPMTLSDAERLGQKEIFLSIEEAERALEKQKGDDEW